MRSEPAESVDGREARRVSSLRIELTARHPFWGELLLSSRLVQAPRLPTFAATDCVRTIWYNPSLTAPLARDQLAFVLLHEVGHQVLESAGRRHGRDPQRWNVACDLAINRVIAAIRDVDAHWHSAYRPPDGEHPTLGTVRTLLDPRFDGLTAEAIYARLRAEDLPGPAVSVQVSLGEGASVVAQDHGGGLDLHLPAEAARSEAAGTAATLAERVQAARRAHGGPGDLGGDAARASGVGASEVDWRATLRAWVEPSGASEEYSLRRPNRRAMVWGVVAPSLVCGEIPHVAVALDTSASMGEAELSAIRAEVGALARADCVLTVLIADAVVHAAAEGAAAVRLLRARRWPGGGGTDHRPVFEWLAARRRRPDLFVGLTDLASRFPEAPPPFPVLWIVPPGAGAAPWGEVVRLRGRGRP